MGVSWTIISVDLVINVREFYANLQDIDGGWYDVILDMNWLSIFYYMIVSRKRRVIFQIFWMFEVWRSQFIEHAESKCC